MKYSLPAIAGGSPIRKKYLTFGAPDIGINEINEVIDSLKSGWLSTGPKVGLFEKNLAHYLGARYAKALYSCTAAMHLSLIASGIKPGDEIITTPLTFSATANVILHVGAKPVFVDVDPVTGNIDPEEIEKHITKKTRAIMPVHLYGRPCRMDEIVVLAKKNSLTVIEDAAHAFGAVYKKKKIGTIGDFTCFSFYVTKNLVTGEGGLVTMKNKHWAEAIEMYALHGMSKGAWKRYSDSGYRHYLIEVPGYKYNMMDIQAAIGIHQLKRFEEMQSRRKNIWKQYDKAFSDLSLQLPIKEEAETIHAKHLYTIGVDKKIFKQNRDFFLQALHKENIGIGVHFISLHIHPYYKNRFGYKKPDFPHAANISDTTISLPISSKLSDHDVSDVIRAVRKISLYYKR